MPPILFRDDRFVVLDKPAQTMLESAFQRLGLTARAHDRLLRIARTIADLENADTVSASHLARALQCREVR